MTVAIPLYVRGPVVRQLALFATVGVFSTLAYSVLFLVLHGALGAQGANCTALLLTTLANTALNRRFTFGVVGAQRRATHHLQGLVVFGLALGLTSGTLFLTHQLAETPSRQTELVVVVAANAAATIMRFLLLRRWVFGRA